MAKSDCIRDPWQQLPNESSKAFEAACLYIRMGPNRSQEAIGKQLSKSRQLLGRWSVRHHWAYRARAFDENNQRIEQNALVAELQKKATEWAAREAALRDQKWEQAQRGIRKVDAMLDYPLAEVTKKTRADGTELTVVKPARWSMGQTARMSEHFFELAIGAVHNKDATVPDQLEEEWVITDYVSKNKANETNQGD